MSIQRDVKEIVKFRDERDWAQFHTPKSLAEVLEFFQWEKGEFPRKKGGDPLEYELADVYYYLILLAHEVDCDLQKSFKEKMYINAMKYPAEACRGKSTKYTGL